MARDSTGSGEIRELAGVEQADRVRVPVEREPADLSDPREDEPRNASDSSGPTDAEYAAETKDYSDFAEAAYRFKPAEVNLPEQSVGDAVRYIRGNADQRPWLKPAGQADLDAQRVIAASDQGPGHHVERHEGFATDERLDRRAAALEDPAQLDPELRAKGRDSEHPDKQHYCRDTATAIPDPDAFAAALANGIRHPDVRAILDRPRQQHEKKPDPAKIPIEYALGERGHLYCAGYRLLPIDGDIEAAKDNRRDWANATPEEREQMVEPQAERVPAEDFRGGTIAVVFCRTPDYQHWTVRTMHPEPRKGNEQQS